MTRSSTAVLGAALLAASGCEVLTLATATPPQVEVAGVQLQGLGLLDQSLSVTLCVSNPNDAALNFRRIMVAVDANGTPLADGASDTAVLLPPHASTLVPFTVVTTVHNLGPQLLGVLRAGGVAYRLRGSVQLTGALAISLPFSRSGRLDLLTGGQELLADAAVPSGTRCSVSPAL